MGGLWAVAVALLPVYVGASGSVQPGHAVMALAALATLVGNAVRRDRLWVAICLLDVVVVARCGWEVLVTGDIGELTPATFFLFNSVIVFALRTFIERGHGMRFVHYGILAALAVAVAGVLLLGVRESIGTSTRLAGTFNNPNQLGYFSTCVSGLLVVAFFRGYLSLPGLVIGLLAGGFLTTVSLSKAALLANIIGIGFLGIGFRRTSLWRVCGILALLATMILGMSVIESGALDHIEAVRRLRLIGQDSDDSLEARGYGLVLFADPSVILFGRGHGDVLDALGQEVHSSIGSMWVEYGAIGALLYVSVLWIWCRSLWARYGLLPALAIAVPPLLFGLTHNGTRATLFWVLVAVVIACDPAGEKAPDRRHA